MTRIFSYVLVDCRRKLWLLLRPPSPDSTRSIWRLNVTRPTLTVNWTYSIHSYSLKNNYCCQNATKHKSTYSNAVSIKIRRYVEKVNDRKNKMLIHLWPPSLTMAGCTCPLYGSFFVLMFLYSWVFGGLFSSCLVVTQIYKILVSPLNWWCGQQHHISDSLTTWSPMSP